MMGVALHKMSKSPLDAFHEMASLFYDRAERIEPSRFLNPLRPVRAVDLNRHVILFVERTVEEWRFNGWKSSINARTGESTQELPDTTEEERSRLFANCEELKDYFAKILAQRT